MSQPCVLLNAFAEFALLPDLLALAKAEVQPFRNTTQIGSRREVFSRWADLLERTGVNLGHVEADEYWYDPRQYMRLAEEVWEFSERVGWINGYRLAGPARQLAAIAERPVGERTEQDARFLERAIAGSVRRHFVGTDGQRVVDLLQDAASQLAGADNAWTRSVPGLLLVEFEALIYWAFRDPGYAASLPAQLTTLRREAQNNYMDPIPLPKEQEVGYETLTLADATATLYVTRASLAADTGLAVTALRSTAMLLTFAGLLQEFPMGPVSYLMPPEPDNG